MVAVTSVPVFFVNSLFPFQHAQPVIAASRATQGRGEEPSTRVRNPRDDAAYTALNTDGDAALLASASP